MLSKRETQLIRAALYALDLEQMDPNLARSLGGVPGRDEVRSLMEKVKTCETQSTGREETDG